MACVYRLLRENLKETNTKFKKYNELVIREVDVSKTLHSFFLTHCPEKTWIIFRCQTLGQQCLQVVNERKINFTDIIESKMEQKIVTLKQIDKFNKETMDFLLNSPNDNLVSLFSSFIKLSRSLEDSYLEKLGPRLPLELQEKILEFMTDDYLKMSFVNKTWCKIIEKREICRTKKIEEQHKKRDNKGIIFCAVLKIYGINQSNIHLIDPHFSEKTNQVINKYDVATIYHYCTQIYAYAYAIAVNYIFVSKNVDDIIKRYCPHDYEEMTKLFDELVQSFEN
jgi:hypothetical protein